MTDIDNTTNDVSFPKRYITVKEAAELISVSPRTIHHLMTQKKIPFIKLRHGVRIPVDFTTLLEGKR